ncbi:MAG TPA: site-specific DNA-methyltransferase [Clostridiales bacterium]|nr:site-specific DNA-methyltransferase [Clostridiales bacterium]
MTKHQIIIGDSKNIKQIPNKSVHLIITSPPYPMIAMWDEIFSRQDPEIKMFLEDGEGIKAFYRMHELLNRTWDECDRVLVDNGFVCINIGDATRTINGDFQLYSNHTQVISYFLGKGYSVLPDILWRKQSNAPNKFMGSGMYPAGAYVTYEHEYILIFRKGGKRLFKGTERELRQKSAFFWEERNVWFSDLWEIKGTSQVISAPKTSRDRSAAFPFEIPYRLVNMYSIEGDTVLDPFAGLGTTNLACMAAKRNSIGVEIDPDIADLALQNIAVPADVLNAVIDSRIKRHLDFIDSLPNDKRERCYKNGPHGFNVKTQQETAIKLDRVSSVTKEENTVICHYE